MRRLLVTISLFLLILVTSPTARSDTFKGGRDVAMMTIGIINVTLLTMLIWHAFQDEPAKKEPGDTPPPGPPPEASSGAAILGASFPLQQSRREWQLMDCAVLTGRRGATSLCR